MSSTTSIPCQDPNGSSKEHSSAQKEMLRIKQQLADALGDSGPLYWKAMKEFVTGSLSRIEFDFYANLYLARQNAHLHNAFILSTIQNAKAHAQPQKPSTQPKPKPKPKRKRTKEIRETQELETRKKLKLNVMSLNTTDRTCLNKLVKAGNTSQLKSFVDKAFGSLTGQSSGSLITRLNDGLNNIKGWKPTPLLQCCKVKELPDRDTLNTRMKRVSIQQGLRGDLGENVVDMMSLALESYLKTIISDIIIKLRVNRRIGLEISSRTGRNGVCTNEPHDKSTDMDYPCKPQSLAHLITSKDLAFTLEMLPSSPAEVPIYKEKLNALYSDSDCFISKQT
ncbi:transcriptional regulator of RNA polII, SAGA, subunit-domain-containing protein [Phycomyces nitens]|nr:transcriptional regulator of RNA polII, SAGA, subunit-domain-containing protein [Phycomyces nitens]